MPRYHTYRPERYEQVGKSPVPRRPANKWILYPIRHDGSRLDHSCLSFLRKQETRKRDVHTVREIPYQARNDRTPKRVFSIKYAMT